MNVLVFDSGVWRLGGSLSSVCVFVVCRRMEVRNENIIYGYLSFYFDKNLAY